MQKVFPLNDGERQLYKEVFECIFLHYVSFNLTYIVAYSESMFKLKYSANCIIILILIFSEINLTFAYFVDFSVLMVKQKPSKSRCRALWVLKIGF